jgi:hypothetical protein
MEPCRKRATTKLWKKMWPAVCGQDGKASMLTEIDVRLAGRPITCLSRSLQQVAQKSFARLIFDARRRSGDDRLKSEKKEKTRQ